MTAFLTSVDFWIECCHTILPASCTNDLRTLFLLVLQFLSWPRLLRKPVARKCWASLFCYPYQPPLPHDHTPILRPVGGVGNLFLCASHDFLLLHSVPGISPKRKSLGRESPETKGCLIRCPASSASISVAVLFDFILIFRYLPKSALWHDM